MSKSEDFPKTFECRVGGYDLSLFIGNCAVALFRSQSEVDYIAVDMPDDPDSTLRVFNNAPLARWMAGYELRHTKHGLIRQPVVEIEGKEAVFRELTGWNPAVVEKEAPSEHELEMFLDVNAENLDREWQAGL